MRPAACDGGHRRSCSTTMSHPAAFLSTALIAVLLSTHTALGGSAHELRDREGRGSAERRGPLELRGRVLLPDDGSPVGLRAYLVMPDYHDSVDVDLEGGFSFRLGYAPCDSVDLRI